MILILSNKWDVSVDFVVKELRDRGHPFLRINTEDMIHCEATIAFPDFHVMLKKGDRTYDLTEDVKVIWNRRPGKPFDDIPHDERPSKSTQKFVNDQWYSWLESLQLIPDAIWINHPHFNDMMESKVRQLWLANKAGFNIPETVITNSPDAATQLLNKFDGQVIAKALFSPLIEEDEHDSFIFSNLINCLPENTDEIKLCPSIFQQPITPKVDYRITVIGDEVIAVKIHAEGDSAVAIDWRTQKEGIAFTSCTLPPEVENLCRKYLREARLLFGAIDLVERDGQFLFLEINPNGEWGWLQKPTGLPIAERLCDLMLRYDRSQERHEYVL